MIELKSIHLASDLNTMSLNVIFVLLDILGAYYAPNNPQFIFSTMNTNSNLISKEKKEELEFITFELKFSISNELKDHFTRKCRV